MIDKKALREQYKRMKKDMGIYSLTCLPTGKIYVGWAQDLHGKMNGTSARLNGSFHVCRNLQADWDRYGAENFRIQVEELMEAEEDESKTDYQEDLKVFLELWLETNGEKYPAVERLK